MAGCQTRSTKGFLISRDPLTQEMIDVSVTVYADDVKEINMVHAAEEAIEVLTQSMNLLNEGILPLGLKQNDHKAEHVPSFLGMGHEKHSKDFATLLSEKGMDESKSVARYLGNYYAYNQSTKVTIQTRIYKAKEAYYALGRIWKTQIDLPIRRMLFKGYVISALLSGLECEALRHCDLKKIEVAHNGLPRRAMNGIFDTLVEGTMHQCSNEDLRKHMKVFTVHSTLRSRRLKWIQNIIKHPEDNVQLRAAVAGKITTKQGDIEEPYSPWLDMIYDDTICLVEEGIA